jgi:hypothetical protein
MPAGGPGGGQDMMGKIIDNALDLGMKDANQLIGEKKYGEAVKVLEQARKRKPGESPRIDAMEAAIKLAMECDEMTAKADRVLRVKKGESTGIIGEHVYEYARVTAVLKTLKPPRFVDAVGNNIMICHAKGAKGLPQEECTVYLVPFYEGRGVPGPTPTTFVTAEFWELLGGTAETGVSHVGAAATQPAREIPLIRSVEELRAHKVPAVAIPGWDLYLGLAEAGGSAGSAMLIYCLAEPRGGGDPNAIHVTDPAGDKSLGGLVHWRLKEKGSKAVTLIEKHSDYEPNYPNTNPMLFCDVICPHRKGDFTVEVLSPDGTLLASAGFKVAEVRPVYWHLFSITAKTANREPQPADGPPRKKEAEFVAGGPTCAALPRYPARRPMREPVRSALPGQLPPVEAPAAATEPGAIDKVGTLDLSLDKGGILRIRCGESMDDDVELHFLARWWLNGKPVAAPTGVGRPISRARAVRSVNELEVPFGLPDCMKEAKAGDEVGLQVLYCPLGWQMLGDLDQAAFRDSSFSMPVLSNRIAFKLTAEMLAGAAAPAGGPAADHTGHGPATGPVTKDPGIARYGLGPVVIGPPAGGLVRLKRGGLPAIPPLPWAPNDANRVTVEGKEYLIISHEYARNVMAWGGIPPNPGSEWNLFCAEQMDPKRRLFPPRQMLDAVDLSEAYASLPICLTNPWLAQPAGSLTPAEDAAIEEAFTRFAARGPVIGRKDVAPSELNVVVYSPNPAISHVRSHSVVAGGDIGVMVLSISVANRSPRPIKASLSHEWYGGLPPPTNLYACVIPSHAQATYREYQGVPLLDFAGTAEIQPAYQMGETGFDAPVIIEPGKFISLLIRLDWHGTGSCPANPIVWDPGIYKMRFALFFEADGAWQYVLGEPVVLDNRPGPAAPAASSPSAPASRPAAPASRTRDAIN